MRSLQRREVLCVLGGLAFARRGAAATALRAARDAVDHIVIGTRDLERGIAGIEAMTGVRPAIGGSHPGRGTRNALFSLGPRQYAELIAPDPEQAGTKDAYGLADFPEPRMLMWAASATDIDAMAAARNATPAPGSRVRPDGRVLSWRTLAIAARPGIVPFFIQWDAGTIHPASDSPAGCTLTALSFEAPDPAAVEVELAAAGISARVTRGPAPRLAATLQTPKGRVTL
ncbi:MAG TPA: VOC family protein [Vicinamibacteria bacterium]|nr:VOC family protein [Vicinamibacteria bacterium]